MATSRTRPGSGCGPRQAAGKALTLSFPLQSLPVIAVWVLLIFFFFFFAFEPEDLALCSVCSELEVFSLAARPVRDEGLVWVPQGTGIHKAGSMAPVLLLRRKDGKSWTCTRMFAVRRMRARKYSHLVP